MKGRYNFTIFNLDPILVPSQIVLHRSVNLEPRRFMGVGEAEG